MTTLERTNGKITLAVEGEHMVVYETAGTKRFRRARFHLGDVVTLVVPNLERLLTGAARTDIETHVSRALDGMFGDETPKG